MDWRALAVSAKPTIGLGILSWRGAQSLRHSLESYQKNGFFELFDDVITFLPDPDEAVLEAVKGFPVRVVTAPENKGILHGMEMTARSLSTDLVFHAENDCPLIENKAESARQIKIASDLIINGKAVMARMRHRKFPGQDFDTYDKYLRYYPHQDTLKTKMRRFFRPGKARRLQGTAIYIDGAHAKKFPDVIEDIGHGFYLVDANVMPWTNQSIIYEREFFLETLMPFCHAVPFRRGANGFPNMEVELNNCRFWRKSGWKIACGPGLLTHKRAESRGY